PGREAAINWQRTDVEARFTSIDRRFPTPQSTTSHVFQPNQRRRASSLLPIWLRNSDFLGRGYDGKPERGRGGRWARSRQHASIHKLTRDFLANGSPALFLHSKKTMARYHDNAAAGRGS